MAKPAENPADYILPLNINGLAGRMMRAPSTSKHQREILLIYGHHAMLERWWGLVENLRAYGNVTMPDLPGFGGMDSFSKIGIKPNIDAFADYLAAFIKLRYKRKTFSIYAVSFGFVVVTRMLQKYPELAGRVDMLVSSVGFMHHDDFLWPRYQQKIYRKTARLFASRPVAFFIRYAALNRTVIRTLTKILPNSKHRFIEVSPTEFEGSIDFEVRLWQANDVRTHWLTTSEFLRLDNTKKPVALPVIHLVSGVDHYFNNTRVEQHMRMVYADYTRYSINSKTHVPHVIADKKDMAVMLPRGLRRLLNKQ